jgi:integrase
MMFNPLIKLIGGFFMNNANLREKYPKLLSHMEGTGYSKGYIGRVRREIERVLLLADSGVVSSYADVYHEYEKSGASPDKLARKRKLPFLVEQFDLYGEFPDGTRRPQTISRGAHHQLCAEYRTIIDYYAKAEKKRGKKDVAIGNESKAGAMFLMSLQQSGRMTLADVTEAHVLAFFALPDGSIVHCSYKKPITAVLKACITVFPLCERVLAYLPVLRPNHRNVQYLIDGEAARVKAVLPDPGSGISLRDKAIITIALHTGLRGSDIAGMRLDSPDWDNDLPHIRQQKTEVPLTLPLSAVVGNAIFDYINDERPKTEHEYVFISKARPFGKLTNVAICGIVQKVMKAANIRQKQGDRQGLHIFRHHVATALLGNGVARPVISSVIGHTSPSSLDPYLSADFPHLKNCAISIEQYPVAEDLFTATKKYVSCFAPLIDSPLSYRKVSENWRSVTYEPNLLIFDRYCMDCYPDADAPLQEMIDSWCEQRDTESNNSCRTRVNAVTALVQYARTRGHANLAPPVAPGTERPDYMPHAFTDEELRNFFDACDNLTGIASPASRSRKITVPVFFRLLYSSGIRTTEARLLHTADIDLERGIINVRLAKGYRQHFIALHDSMTELLRKYDVAIKETCPSRTYFFPASENKCHTAGWAERDFGECWFKGNKAYAIPYELRHHYATANINGWVEDGFGFDAKFLYLSKSMGHSVIESTKYHYSPIPRLSDILEERTNADFEDIVPEVRHEEVD